jgi:hypothetical protein
VVSDILLILCLSETAIAFSMLNPLLFLGDVGEESAVLGWCLTQAGVNPRTAAEEAANYALLPAVSAAATAPPPINKAWIN